MNNSLTEIFEKMKKAKTVAVFCHVRPDGDAIGSGLAITLALRNMGKRAYMCCEDLPPKNFSFLTETQNVMCELPHEEVDTFICCDCADISRLGIFSKDFQRFKGETINIDHHISNIGYAKTNYVEVCPATSEIVTELFRVNNVEITKPIANLLMLGIITDSGNFTHNDVSERTYMSAAILRKAGADPNIINYNLFSRQPKARALVYGGVMSKMRFALDDKLAIIVITKTDMEKLDNDKSLTEGFVDFPLSIDGVEVSVSLLEFKNEQYKTSLRSKGAVNVNKVAAAFGGGGHILASGCMLFGSLEEVVEKITLEVYRNI